MVVNFKLYFNYCETKSMNEQKTSLCFGNIIFLKKFRIVNARNIYKYTFFHMVTLTYNNWSL